MEFQLKNQQFQKNQLNQKKILLFLLRERPLMMSDYGGMGGQKSSKNRRTSFMDDPLDGFQTFAFESHWQNFKSFYSQH